MQTIQLNCSRGIRLNDYVDSLGQKCIVIGSRPRTRTPDRRNVEATAGFEGDVVVNYASACDRPFLFLLGERKHSTALDVKKKKKISRGLLLFLWRDYNMLL